MPNTTNTEYKKLFKLSGKKLSKLRVAKGITLLDAALRLKIPPSKLTNIEKGDEGFTIPLLYQFALMYGFEPSDFVNSLDVKNTQTKMQ